MFHSADVTVRVTPGPGMTARRCRNHAGGTADRMTGRRHSRPSRRHGWRAADIDIGYWSYVVGCSVVKWKQVHLVTSFDHVYTIDQCHATWRPL